MIFKPKIGFIFLAFFLSLINNAAIAGGEQAITKLGKCLPRTNVYISKSKIDIGYFSKHRIYNGLREEAMSPYKIEGGIFVDLGHSYSCNLVINNGKIIEGARRSFVYEDNMLKIYFKGSKSAFLNSLDQINISDGIQDGFLINLKPIVMRYVEGDSKTLPDIESLNTRIKDMSGNVKAYLEIRYIDKVLILRLPAR